MAGELPMKRHDDDRFWRRLTLTRADGRKYLDRWGISTKWFTVYLHKMSAPDPGEALHNHPWNFITIPLWGGYEEWREKGGWRACEAVRRGGIVLLEARRPLRPHRLRLSEAHRIVMLRRRVSWSLVIAGRLRRECWGFYTADGFIESSEYDGRGLVAS